MCPAPGETPDTSVMSFNCRRRRLRCNEFGKGQRAGSARRGRHAVVFLSLLGSKLENPGTHGEWMGRAKVTCPGGSAHRPRSAPHSTTPSHTTSSEELGLGFFLFFCFPLLLSLFCPLPAFPFSFKFVSFWILKTAPSFYFLFFSSTCYQESVFLVLESALSGYLALTNRMWEK